MGRIFFLVLTICSFQRVDGRIINIPADFPTIQAGIDSSANGDTALVAPGTYYENINFNGHNILLCSRFIMTGDTTDIYSTTVNGGATHTVITLNHGETDLAAIIGITIRNGRADWHNDYKGGGIYCESADVRIIDNFITQNTARGFGDHGGGIACVGGANCKIYHNLITQNRAGEGGGIYCSSSDPYIIANIIVEDTARFSGEDGWGGGGIFLVNSSPLITGNIIARNVGDMGGGGIESLVSSMPLIVNNVIYGNSSFSYGGGLYFYDSSPSIFNNILWNNGQSEIYAQSSNPTIMYCDLQHGWSGEGNISADPLFRDPLALDFHLMSLACGDSIDSPCIDAGNPDSSDAELNCLAGLGTSRADMGAYGGGGNITGIRPENPVQIPTRYILSQNYPNPFNPSTTIKYNLPLPCRVRIDIYDILGRRVANLVDEEQVAGAYQVVWNAGDKTSGIYFYRIQAGEFVETRKMMLLK